MISFKPEVKLHSRNLEPHIMQGLQIARITAPALRGDLLVVTSACDSQHSTHSFHYQGRAWDIRLRDPHERDGEPLDHDEISTWVADLKRWLPDWDVIDEGDHLHLEYDPH
jgi:hypothetical protein